MRLQGKIQYATGDIYEGSFDREARSGQGTYTWADGHVYEGSWSKGRRNGYGIMYNSNGDIIYDGMWIYGKYDDRCSKVSIKLNNKGIYKNGKHPDRKTVDGYYCQYSDTSLCEKELQYILINSGIEIINGVNVRNMNKSDICTFLNDDYEKYEIMLNNVPENKKPPSGFCNNPENLLGDSFDDINIDRIIKDEFNNCYTLEELSEMINPNNNGINPYTRTPFSDTLVNEFKDKYKNYIGKRHVPKDETLTWNSIATSIKSYYEYVGDELDKIKDNNYDYILKIHRIILDDYQYNFFFSKFNLNLRGSDNYKKLAYLAQLVDNDINDANMRTLMISEFIRLVRDINP